MKLFPRASKVHRWPVEVKQQVQRLREKHGWGPLKLAEVTGVPIGQIRYWLYTYSWRKTWQKRKAAGKTKIKDKKAAAESSRSSYHRRKLRDWYAWKADTLVSSLQRYATKFSRSREEIPTRTEIRDWLEQASAVCFYCTEDVDPRKMGVDHAQPLARGGSNALVNLRFCCRSCNTSKGVLTEAEFRALLNLLATWEDQGKSLLARLRRGFVGRK